MSQKGTKHTQQRENEYIQRVTSAFTMTVTGKENDQTKRLSKGQRYGQRYKDTTTYNKMLEKYFILVFIHNCKTDAGYFSLNKVYTHFPHHVHNNDISR